MPACLQTKNHPPISSHPHPQTHSRTHTISNDTQTTKYNPLSLFNFIFVGSLFCLPFPLLVLFLLFILYPFLSPISLLGLLLFLYRPLLSSQLTRKKTTFH
ncbi:hypothetical protein BKA57DRAFT_453339 [Linnemannia elongata]|nr:hypothetical protein BKA57DRAFT_453339 [Linnemannia elongata]